MSKNEEKTPKQDEERKECCPDNGGPQSDCCGGQETSGTKGKCASKCQYFPLFPVVLGALFLALGYFLSPAIVRILWLAGAGLFVSMGLVGLLAMRRMAAKVGSSGCC